MMTLKKIKANDNMNDNVKIIRKIETYKLYLKSM